MVTQWIVEGLATVWAWFIGVIPAPEPPSWFGDAASGISEFTTAFHWLDAWAPLPLVAAIITAYLAVMLIGWAATILRMLLSLFTFGGGGL